MKLTCPILIVLGCVMQSISMAQNATAPTPSNIPDSTSAPAVSPAAILGKVGDIYPELKLKDGRTFKEVKVKEIQADGIKVIHADGGSRIPYDQLPDELLTKYGINPDIAAKAAEERKAADAAQLKAVNEVKSKSDQEKKVSLSKSARGQQIEQLRARKDVIKARMKTISEESDNRYDTEEATKANYNAAYRKELDARYKAAKKENEDLKEELGTVSSKLYALEQEIRTEERKIEEERTRKEREEKTRKREEERKLEMERIRKESEERMRIREEERKQEMERIRKESEERSRKREEAQRNLPK